MFNKIKSQGEIPSFMRKATVTTIPKKGSKLDLKNERGIFLVSSVRSIFMRLLYNIKKKTLDSHMSDSNVGGRQNKSGINHIWVINCIIHDQVSSVTKKPVVIQQYDYTQMFDSMDNNEACGNIYNYGINETTGPRQWPPPRLTHLGRRCWRKSRASSTSTMVWYLSQS